MERFASNAVLRLMALLLVIAAAPGCAVLGSYSPTARVERYGIFQPAKYPNGDWQPTAVLVQDAEFAAQDGTKLHGWYVRHAEPKGHALLLHGNAGNVTLLADTLRALNRRHNLVVLALDYRGFGKSEGTPSEQGLYQDARAARKWLAAKEGIAETDVILMGVSVGGAVAVDLASQDGARGLVLSNTFTTLPAAAQHLWPLVPMNLILSTRMNSLAKIKEYRGPLLISHGEADEIVPFAQGQALYDAAPSANKRLFAVPGGKHNDPQPEEYRVALDEFLNQLPPVGTNAVKSAIVDVEVASSGG